MSINQNNVKKLTENLQKSHNEYSSSYYTFFKNTTTICTGLIALIIGLKPEQILCFYSKVFFLLSISFIGLCILFSLIVQYAEIYIKKELIKISNSQLINYIENPDKSKIMSNSVKKKKRYFIAEIMTYCCLLLSLVSLILYSYFSEFSQYL